MPAQTLRMLSHSVSSFSRLKRVLDDRLGNRIDRRIAVERRLKETQKQ